MKLLSRTKTLLASLALAAMAGGAQADVIEIKGYSANGINYGSNVIAPGVYEGVAALWNVNNLDDGSSFLAFCLQLLEPVDANGGHNYTAGSYTPSADVQELFDRYYASVLDSRERAVGFQLALWDLTGQASVSSFVAPSAAVAQARALIDDVRNGTGGYTPGRYKYTEWTNDGLQDVLQVTLASNEVPEPQTHALMLGGLGLLAMVARRRKNGAAR